MKVRVQQDSDQILFSSVPAQQRPRHAFIPRWHFDMVQDHMRNAAYDQAISRVSLLVLSTLMQGVFHAFCMGVVPRPHAQGGTLTRCIIHVRSDVQAMTGLSAG